MFLLGHSHVAALEQGATRLGIPYRSLNLWGFGQPLSYDDAPAPPRLVPALAEMLGDFVVSAVGGSAHDMVGLAQHPRRFDFVLPEAPDLPIDPDAELVPAAAVRALIENAMTGLEVDLIRALPAPGRRVVHVESPPPSGDMARLGAEMSVLAFVPQPNPGPSPPWLRYKLWRVHSAIIRGVCEHVGIEYVPAPPATMVDGGFLAPALHDFPCHANGDFGAIVLTALLGLDR